MQVYQSQRLRELLDDSANLTCAWIDKVVMGTSAQAADDTLSETSHALSNRIVRIFVFGRHANEAIENRVGDVQERIGMFGNLIGWDLKKNLGSAAEKAHLCGLLSSLQDHEDALLDGLLQIDRRIDGADSNVLRQ